MLIGFLLLPFIQVTASDGDKDRPQNIVYFLTGQGIDPDNPANSKFDINRTTGEIFVLKVRPLGKSIKYSIQKIRFISIFISTLYSFSDSLVVDV